MRRKGRKNVRVLNNELEEIKERWLKKEITLDELTHELISYNKSDKDLASKKEVLNLINNKLILDTNVEASHEKLINISLAFIPIMISYIAFFMSIFEMDKLLTAGYSVAVLLLTTGLTIIIAPVFKKHSGKYCREKSFYQIALGVMNDNTNTEYHQ